MGTDRTWLIRKMVERPVDMPIASIIGPYCSDPVSVVEESRLREAEAELNVCEHCGHKQAEPNWCQKCSKRPSMRPWAINFLNRIEAEKEDLRSEAEQAEARVERLEAELREALEALRHSAGHHHDTIIPSRLHDPEHLSFDDCPAKTCARARGVLEKDGGDVSGA